MADSKFQNQRSKTKDHIKKTFSKTPFETIIKAVSVAYLPTF
jgi:hypothetical protein